MLYENLNPEPRNVEVQSEISVARSIRYWMLGAGALGQPRGMVWGGRREEGSRWGTHVCLWWIDFDIWQNQYNIVKFKNKIKLKKNEISVAGTGVCT